MGCSLSAPMVAHEEVDKRAVIPHDRIPSADSPTFQVQQTILSSDLSGAALALALMFSSSTGRVQHSYDFGQNHILGCAFPFDILVAVPQLRRLSWQDGRLRRREIGNVVADWRTGAHAIV